jgi:hypothetical protein
MTFDVETARARVLCETVLPLLEPLATARPEIAERLAHASGVVQIEADGSDVAARLMLGDARVRVAQGRGDADVRCVFGDVGAMNAFFAGRPALPRLKPVWAIAKGRLLLETGRLLAALRVLEPPSARARAHMTRAERALRVRLVLTLVTRAIAQLRREGWEPAIDLSAGSPERVYQWKVSGGEIASWLRVEDGRIDTGVGLFEGRRPFVTFAFPDVDAAFDVLMATEGSIEGFKAGRVETTGSPEYARKVSLVMQKVDALLAP